MLLACDTESEESKGAEAAAEGKETEKEKKPPVVTLHTVEKKTFRDEWTYGGLVVAHDVNQVVTETAGRLVALHKKLGQRVSKGQKLATLQPSNLRGQFQAIHLVAQSSGIVGALPHPAGTWLPAGEVVATLRHQSRFEVEAQLLPNEAALATEKDRWTAAIATGEATPLRIPLEPQLLSREVDPKTRLVPARFWISCSALKEATEKSACEKSLLPGQRVTVSYLKEERQSAAVPPKVFHVGIDRVIVVKDGKAEHRGVTIKSRDATHVEVSAGLEEGETLVLNYDRKPQHDEVVTPEEPQASEEKDDLAQKEEGNAH